MPLEDSSDLFLDESDERPKIARRAPAFSWRKIYFILATIALVLGALCGVLSWLGRAPNPLFIPLCVREYKAGLPALEPNGAALLSLFPQARSPESDSQDAGQMQQQLASLRTCRKRDHVVLYVNAHALRDERGAIQVLPADATPNNPVGWLALKTVLENLRACPARHKLLILDIMKPLPQPQWGVLTDDVADFISDELDAVPDEQRLVLCACGPAQTAVVSEELGRSAFGYYLEEGLRGYADGHGLKAQRDGRVSVRELAAFVAMRVERWAALNRGVRQMPVLLGSGPDFPLVALKHGQRREHVPSAGAKEYPEWLLAAWKQRDSRWRDGTYRQAPRVFQQYQAALLEAERSLAWADPESTAAELRRLDSEFERQRRLGMPVPTSRAQAAALGIPVDKDTPASQPRFAEDLLRLQLKDLKSRLLPVHWPQDTVEQLMQVARQGETLLAKLDAFPWIQDEIAEAAQARHDGEICFWARGYTAIEEADAFLKRAGELYETLLQRAATIDEAHDTLSHGLALLPWFPAYFEGVASGEKIWSAAAVSTAELHELLRVSANNPRPASLETVQRRTQVLSILLAELNRQFRADHVEQLLVESKQPTVGVDLYRRLRAILAIPHPHIDAARRVQLWTALRDVGRRLHLETMQIDRLENEGGQVQGMPEVPIDTGAAQATAQRRARMSLMLLELGGITSKRSGLLREQMKKWAEEPEAGARCSAFGIALWQTWSHELFGQLEHAAAVDRLRWSWLVPPHLAVKSLDDEPSAAQVRGQQAARLFGWLVPHQLYQARDYEGSGLEGLGAAAARDFYRQVAQANQALAGPAPTDLLEIHPPAAPVRLSGQQTTGAAVVELKRPAAVPVQVAVLKPESSCLQVSPEEWTLPADEGQGIASETLRMDLRFRPEALGEQEVRPRGFLIQADSAGRHYHRLVPVVLPPGPNEVQVLISSRADRLEAVEQIRLRPNGRPQKFHVFAKNPTDAVQKVVVKVSTNLGPLPGAVLSVTLQPGETRRLLLEAQSPAAASDFHGPLYIELVDAAQKSVIHWQPMTVEIASPEDYVEISDIKFVTGPSLALKNRLTVRMRTKPMSGSAMPAELVLSPRLMPGFTGVGSAVVQAELSAAGDEATLFAENLRFKDGVQGLIALNVDGMPRAFLYRLGQDEPERVTEPMVRLAVPRFLAPRPKLSLPIEVDNAPPGARLEISHGRPDGDGEPDWRRVLPTAKKQAVRLRSADGALIFDASIRDWTVELNTSQILGRRAIRARLLDADGDELCQTVQPLVIDGTEPEEVRFIGVPKQSRSGSTVRLRAAAEDGESEIESMYFFIGKPNGGQVPTQAVRIGAQPLAGGPKTWVAPFPLPDKKGPIDITVQAINGAGLSSFVSTTIELLDANDVPAATEKGTIRGKVTEGTRLQPGLIVILKDENGTELARTKTEKNGTYLFNHLAPGRYLVFCSKPSSGRRATSKIIVVRPGKGETANLALTL